MTKSFSTILINLEYSACGKPAKWINDSNNSRLSIIIFGLSLFFTLYLTISENTNLSSVEISIKKLFFLIIYAFVSFLLIWLILVSTIKGTIFRNFGLSFAVISSAFLIYILCNWLFGFILIEANWDVVWAHRIQLFAGPEMHYLSSQSENHYWRLWLPLAIFNALLCSSYGTSENISDKYFLTLYIFIITIIMLFTWFPSERNYDATPPLLKFFTIGLIGIFTFLLTRRYCINSETYIINRFKSILILLTISAFFLTIFIMNPPGIFVEADLMEEGLAPILWSGLFVNIILATVGGFLGLCIGIFLAFGRQSNLLIFSIPSTVIIETIRAGPFIAWLFFAKYLLDDIISPFLDLDSVMRMLVIFAFFGGCYIAETLRGGIQTIRTGQLEAATALGLSPFQIKMSIILPNSIRTTLPSLVSQLIGLWKDTTLLYIIGVFDFLFIANTLTTRDLKFALDVMEPLYMAAFVFWIVAFYLSRVSLNIEKKLGLDSLGGGERV